jgi:CheY-like chemotaxis protein
VVQSGKRGERFVGYQWELEVRPMLQAPLIAIINDDPAFLEFISSFLEDETPYRTVVWDDGVHSLPKLREHLPSLVILDVRIGDQAVGQQILESMRCDDELCDTPVIVCTADQQFIRENEEVIRSLDADVLEKPFDLELLEEKVEFAINGAPAWKSKPDPVG